MIKKNTQKYWWLYLGVLVLSFIIILIIFKINQTEEVIEVPVEVEDNQSKLECEYRRKIDGICLDEADDQFVYAVMIDNHSDARRQSGLTQASLIYEAIVESPITRFLAIFSSVEEVEAIGPIRSARPFYIDWSMEFYGPYIHVGGSNQALDILARTYKYDINEFSNGSYFWRSNLKFAPHNTYTSSDNIKQIVEKKDWQIADNFKSWIFKPDLAFDDRPDEQIIEIPFASFTYAVKWVYDRENNDYLRYQGGSVFKDSDGNEIKSKNIAIMYTDSKVIDDYGRRQTTTVGQDKAIVFQDGNAIEGYWQRDDVGSRTRFFNNLDEEIKFNAGQTWIEVVPNHFDKVVY